MTVTKTLEIVISTENFKDQALMDQATGNQQMSAHQDVQKTGSAMAFVTQCVRMMTANKTLAIVISTENSKDQASADLALKAQEAKLRNAHQDAQSPGSEMTSVIILASMMSVIRMEEIVMLLKATEKALMTHKINIKPLFQTAFYKYHYLSPNDLLL